MIVFGHQQADKHCILSPGLTNKQDNSTITVMSNDNSPRLPNPRVKMKNTTVQVIDDVDYGMYVWVMPDGLEVGDSDGNIMNIQCKRGDKEAIRKITEAARFYGITEGTPCFLSGRRRVTDSQYEDQKARMKAGLTADPLDPGAIRDELEYIGKFGKQ
jgi:hypothetical protein